MQLDFDSLSVVLSNVIAAFQGLAAWLNVRLMSVGLDPTTIVMRGPSLVLMGLAFSAVRYLLCRIWRFGAERAKLLFAEQLEVNKVYGKQLVYAMSNRGNLVHLQPTLKAIGFRTSLNLSGFALKTDELV